jgi:hypothetical protein
LIRLVRPTKITFADMRDRGVRGLLIYCADYRCSDSIAIRGDRWPDDARLSNIEPWFICGACGHRGAEVRPDFCDCREPDEICGRSIRKGAEIAILPWVLHRHRTLWETPDCFDPERFSRERSATRPRFAYLPFGGGPRICIGAQLALTEVSLLVSTMAQRYRLKLVPAQDIVLLHRVTLRPRGGIRMQLVRRN